MSSNNGGTKGILRLIAITVGILIVLSAITYLLTGSVTTGIGAFVSGVVAIAFSLYLFRNRLGWENGTG